jgi:hypothetical protein
MVQIGSPPSQATLNYVGPSAGAFITVPMALWPPGTTVPFVSSGSALTPPWSTTLVLPGIPSVAAPAIDAAVTTLSRNGDLSVTWQGTPDLDVSLLQFATQDAELAYCKLSGGGGVLPAAVLGLLPAGSYDLQFFAVNRQYFVVGSWFLRVSLESLGLCLGNDCEFEVMLQ